MKFKLDENIGHRGEELLKAAGHDVVTSISRPSPTHTCAAARRAPTRSCSRSCPRN